MEASGPILPRALPSSVSRRRLVPEVMDDPELDTALHEEALRGLGRINRLSRSAAMLWPAIRDAYRVWSLADTQQRPFRVLDLACGGGDVLLEIARLAKRHDLLVEFIGADMSETALAFARRSASAVGIEVRWVQIDAIEHPMPDGVDLSMNSLFMHHLTEAQAVTILQKMAAASDTVLINDLRRGPLAYTATVLGTRLLSRSPVVHVDGPRSVRAAWTPAELVALAERAGLTGATSDRRFPWRMLMQWRNPDRGKRVPS